MTSYTQVAVGSAISLGLSAVTYPLNHARVLAQIGHKPLPVNPATSFFSSKTVYYYPSLLEYAKCIKDTDGWAGLYRGFPATVLGKIVKNQTTKAVSKYLPEVVEDSVDDYIKETARLAVVNAAGIIVAQPLYVVSVRMIAQYVGKETYYPSIWSAIGSIYEDEGILGLFAGLAPMIVGEFISILLIRSLDYFSRPYMPEITKQVEEMYGQSNGKEVVILINGATSMTAGAIVYPFSVVSAMMAVNGAPIAGGLQRGIMFTGWTECFRYLRVRGELKRGSAVFFRAASGVLQ